MRGKGKTSVQEALKSTCRHACVCMYTSYLYGVVSSLLASPGESEDRRPASRESRLFGERNEEKRKVDVERKRKESSEVFDWR